MDELAWRVERMKAYGLIFGVEAHVGSIVSEPLAAARLIEAVPGLTLTLDYTHFTRLGMADREIEPLVKYASHFHVRGAHEGRLQESFAAQYHRLRSGLCRHARDRVHGLDRH